LTIEQFIRKEIATVDNLRALLLLQSTPQVVWNMITVSGRLYLPPNLTSRVLEELAGKGLIEVAGDQAYRYQAKVPELERLVERVAQLDREQPVSLLNLIYARPEDVPAFADAFRLRKDGN